MNNNHIPRFLKLPFKFDEHLLKRDLETIEESWTPHFVKKNYTGEWTSLALYSNTGNARDIIAMPAESGPIQETTLLQSCPYLQEVVSHFKCPFQSVRLMKLTVGSEIKEHTDYNLGYEDGCFRLHIPITTHSEVEFMLDGNRLDMKPGECWYTNVNFRHSVANRGLTDRVHLVIDGEKNDWSDQIFYSLAPKESYEKKQAKYSIETLESMIKSLEEFEDEAAPQLIEDLKKELESRKK